MIIVLLIGSGKSILFILPAFMDNASISFGLTNIVIVLFVVLVEDLIARVREFDIDCFRWQQLIDEE